MKYHTDNPVLQEEQALYGTADDAALHIRDLRGGHWFWVENEAIRWLPTLGAKAFTVYMLLCRFANNDNGTTCLSWKGLQAMTGIGRDAIRTSLRLLETHEIIRRCGQRRTGQRFGSCSYALLKVPNAPHHSSLMTGFQASENQSSENKTPEFQAPQDKSTIKDLGFKQDLSFKKTPEKKETLAEPEAQPTPAYSPGFLQFWAAYPRKVKKQKAWQSWKRQRLEKMASLVIASVIHHREADPQWQRGYIPHPPTYLNDGCWEDDVSGLTPTLAPASQRKVASV